MSEARSSPALLVVEGLRVVYDHDRGLIRRSPGIHAVAGVTLYVDGGEFVAVVGESGSGKTSLGHAILGLAPISAGSVRLCGVDLSGLGQRRARAARQPAQLIMQDPYDALDPFFSIERIISEALRAHEPKLRRLQRKARVEAALQEVGLVPAAEFARRRPHELSGGQLQRVSIAAALVVHPRLLIADEPVSMLDVSVRAEILLLLEKLRSTHGMGIMMITHDLPTALAFADRVIVMREGSIIADGPPAEIRDRPADPYIRELLAAAPGRRRLTEEAETLVDSEVTSPAFEEVELPEQPRLRVVRRIGPRPRYIGASPTRKPMTFHRKLPGYSATPLIRTTGLANTFDLHELYIKDESRRLGLPSFKILGASWAIYRVLCQRLGAELDDASNVTQVADAFASLRPLTFIAATDGNHGRAVAHVARLLGFESHILVPAGTAAARIRAIAEEGATVETIAGSYDIAVESAAARQDDRTILIADTASAGDVAVPTWISEGYSTIFWEIDDELQRTETPPPDLVIVQIGVGALAQSVVAHYRMPGAVIEPTIVGVEPLSAACALETAAAGRPTHVPGPHTSVMAGLNAGRVSPTAMPALTNGVDAFLAIEDTTANEAVRLLARHNITAGETGAAGIAALIACSEAVRTATDAQPTRALVLVTEAPTDPASYSSALRPTADEESIAS